MRLLIGSSITTSQVYVSTQHPTETQTILAQVLGIAKNQAAVACLRMDGASSGSDLISFQWSSRKRCQSQIQENYLTQNYSLDILTAT